MQIRQNMYIKRVTRTTEEIIKLKNNLVQFYATKYGKSCLWVRILNRIFPSLDNQDEDKNKINLFIFLNILQKYYKSNDQIIQIKFYDIYNFISALKLSKNDELLSKKFEENKDFDGFQIVDYDKYLKDLASGGYQKTGLKLLFDEETDNKRNFLKNIYNWIKSFKKDHTIGYDSTSKNILLCIESVRS